MITMMRLSWREMVRKRVFLIALLLSAAFLLAYGLGLHYLFEALRDQIDSVFSSATVFGSQIMQAGLYFGQMVLAFLAITGAVGAIAGEVETGTILGVAAQPIRRRDIVLGKLAGTGLVLIIYSILMFVGIIVLNVTMANPIAVGLEVAPMAGALGLFVLMPLIVLVATFWASSHFPTMAAGIGLILLYGMSMIGNVMETIGKMARVVALENIGIVASLLLPVQAVGSTMVRLLFRPAGGGVNLFVSTGIFWGGREPSLLMWGYITLYLTMVVWAAARHFARRDL
jgi:ABC-type transport system involved in multi-copper enzyme maturation permease subunit